MSDVPLWSKFLALLLILGGIVMRHRTYVSESHFLALPPDSNRRMSMPPVIPPDSAEANELAGRMARQAIADAQMKARFVHG